MIHAKGHLDSSWQAWFTLLQLAREATGTTVLSGALPDQAVLYGTLFKLDRLGITVLALESAESGYDAGTGRRG